MIIFVFDYSGTLDLVTDPVKYIEALRAQYPGCKVVLYTGTDRAEVDTAHPGLCASCDLVYEKPDPLLNIVGGATKIVYVDDEPFLRSMAHRLSRATPNVPWEILEPGALPKLLAG